MMAFKDFYGKQADMYSFIYIPKFLMTSDAFSEIQNDSKIIYGFLLDRMKLSLSNQWIDSHGRVYLRYPVKELEKDIGMSRRKIMECLRELKQAGLLEAEQEGQVYTGLMYLKHITVEQSSDG